MIKVWTRITDHGDGSSGVKLYPTEALAREGLDENGFEEYAEVPCEIDYTLLDVSLCEKVQDDAK